MKTIKEKMALEISRMIHNLEAISRGDCFDVEIPKELKKRTQDFCHSALIPLMEHLNDKAPKWETLKEFEERTGKPWPVEGNVWTCETCNETSLEFWLHGKVPIGPISGYTRTVIVDKLYGQPPEDLLKK